VIGYRTSIALATPPSDAMDIYVQARSGCGSSPIRAGQLGERAAHPGRPPVRLLMTSRDVIHSFYVPEFRVKQDVIPGRYSQVWFQAVEPGRFQILCAEYCGAGHSIMRAR